MLIVFLIVSNIGLLPPARSLLSFQEAHHMDLVCCYSSIHVVVSSLVLNSAVLFIRLKCSVLQEVQE